MLRWRYEEPPSGADRLVLCEEDGEVVGFIGIVYGGCFIDGRAASVSVYGDLLVDGPRGRGGGRLLREEARSRDRADARYAFPKESLATWIETTPHRGRLRQWVRWLTPEGVSASRQGLPRWLRTAALALPSTLSWGPRGRSWTVAPVPDPGAEVDDLAARSAGFARCILRRDAAYLRWRWLGQPGGRWIVLGAWDGAAQLRGWIVVGRREGEVREAGVGRVVDVLADGGAAARALLDAATRALRSAGCGVVLLHLNDPRRWSALACLRAGFVPRGRGPNLHLWSRPGAEAAGEPGSWYLTLGDTDLG